MYIAILGSFKHCDKVWYTLFTLFERKLVRDQCLKFTYFSTEHLANKVAARVSLHVISILILSNSDFVTPLTDPIIYKKFHQILMNIQIKLIQNIHFKQLKNLLIGSKCDENKDLTGKNMASQGLYILTYFKKYPLFRGNI